MAKPRKLTHRQELFCYHYVELGGERFGVDAAIAAGYSKNRKAVKVTVSELLQNPLVDARIIELTNKKQAKREVLADAVAFDALSELADQARAWRSSDDGVQMCHVRAAELYMHNSGQSPEAKKIMAEIKSKASGVTPDIPDDFKPEWAKRVN